MDPLQLTLTEAQSLLAFLSSSRPVHLPTELASLSTRLQAQLSSRQTQENPQPTPSDSVAGSGTPAVPQFLQPQRDRVNLFALIAPTSSCFCFFYLSYLASCAHFFVAPVAVGFMHNKWASA
ncbi:hypothetical protein EV361DRAFT_956827 [Lentinula raphanica]|nr:hypothetical protein EV361DRAFT_956827 [Lentinula raphanica]